MAFSSMQSLLRNLLHSPGLGLPTAPNVNQSSVADIRLITEANFHRQDWNSLVIENGTAQIQGGKDTGTVRNGSISAGPLLCKLTVIRTTPSDGQKKTIGTVQLSARSRSRQTRSTRGSTGPKKGLNRVVKPRAHEARRWNRALRSRLSKGLA